MPGDKMLHFWRSVPVVVKNHDQELMLALHKQQQNGSLCDVWLVIENEKFAAHKAVLASFSSYFQTLFESGLQTDVARSKACNVKEIHLSSVKKSTFLPILHFIYTARLHLFKENIGDVLRTSRKLQIASIVEICNKIIEESIVLPSLHKTKGATHEGAAAASGKAKSNVLYVDLSNGDGEEDSGKEDGVDALNNLENHVGSSRGGKGHLGFENLPDTHSNGWPMRSCEVANSSSGPVSETPTESLQVRSVYSISPTFRRGQAAGASSSEIFSAHCASNQSKRYGKKTKNIPRKNDIRLGCAYCNKFFSKKTNLKRHILIKHSSNHRFSCPRCERKYAIEQSLRYHMATAHGIVAAVSSASFSNESLGNLHTQDSQAETTYVQPSTSPVCVLSSLAPSNSSLLENQKVTSSMPETSLGSTFLPHSLSSTAVEDAISLTIPTTTLFPSIGNLGEPAGFDRLDPNAGTDADSSTMYKFCHSSPIQEHPANSDDDMPTISRIESIREHFLESSNDALDHSSISIDSASIREAMDMESDILVKADPDNRQKDGNDVGEAGANVSSTGAAPTKIQDSSQPDTTTSTNPLQYNFTPFASVATSSTSPTVTTNKPQLESSNKISEVQLRPRLLPNQVLLPALSQEALTESPLTGILNLPTNDNTSRFPHLMPKASSLTSLVSSTQNQQPVSTSLSLLNLECLPHCSTCNKVFQSSDRLSEHRRKCCKCPFCQRVFSQYCNMKRHVDVFHSKHKPHKCRVCGRAYGIKQSMQLHMQTKHGIPYITRKYRSRQGKET